MDVDYSTAANTAHVHQVSVGGSLAPLGVKAAPTSVEVEYPRLANILRVLARNVDKLTVLHMKAETRAETNGFGETKTHLVALRDILDRTEASHALAELDLIDELTVLHMDASTRAAARSPAQKV